MKTARLNFIVDIAAFITFVLMISTGVLLVYTLPPGSGRAITIWGMSRHDWGDIHLWMSMVFLATVSIHTFLHWRWIVTMLRGGAHQAAGGWRFVIGGVSLLCLLALAAAPYLFVETSGDTARPGAAGEHRGWPAREP